MNTTDHALNGEMTEYQKGLVEKNLALVPFAMRQFSPPSGMDSDEWYSELLFILCRSAMAFEPERGFQFSTYFMNTVRFTKKNILRWNYNLKRDIRRNTPLGEEECQIGGDDFDPAARLQNLEACKQYKELINLLPLKDWVKIAELKGEGYNHREIGRMMKRSRNSIGNSWLSAVDYIRKHIRAKNMEMAV
jgi:DNA-directed RNA polymerase specialized sigma24 family protein